MGEFGRHTPLYLRFSWWAMRDSNPRLPPCKGLCTDLRKSPKTPLPAVFHPNAPVYYRNVVG